MPSNKSRYVTACQQLLALGAVLAVLTPAAAVVSLDVVHRDPDPAGPAGAAGAAYARVSAEASLVPAEPVEATVEEFSLTAPSVAVHGRAAVPQLEAEQERTPQGTAVLTSTPQDVEGYGAVGVTWSADAALGESDLELSARTRTGETWSDWTPLEYHDEHGPDAGSLEASRVRPGTDELLVGRGGPGAGAGRGRHRRAARGHAPRGRRPGRGDPDPDRARRDRGGRRRRRRAGPR